MDGQLFTVGPPVPSRSEARAGFEKSCSLRFRETFPPLPETQEWEPPPLDPSRSRGRDRGANTGAG